METSPPALETEDKDLPLREDIRLLGRILGDTIREQGGEAVFETVTSGGVRGAVGVRGQHAGAGRLAALNQNKGQRDEDGGNGDPAPSRGSDMPERAQ